MIDAKHVLKEEMILRIIAKVAKMIIHIYIIMEIVKQHQKVII